MQECRVLMRYLEKKGCAIYYPSVNIKFVEIDHQNNEVTFNDKATFDNKIKVNSLTAFIKRI